MKVIGLTGGIGSGKSTVARFLAEAGATILDLDKVGHEVLKRGGGAYQAVVDEFGAEILNTNGDIDRAKLGKIVFNDREALKRFNRIVHPVIDKTVERKIEELRRQGVKAVVLEAAAMLENKRSWPVDEIWVTVTSEKSVLGRLKERSGYSEEETRTRIRSQMKNADRLRQADVVIDTDCSMDELKVRVKAEWEKLLKRL